ncbi:four-helix bundle copper-binding protein [Erwinia persicina]|uniref:four-helix bundle copper-binding protein n=1 Tax=Erwinia persicina TaxID=55211 RepID=UPI0016541BCE|nr:four-helix bundle copper-binding protein [Erwinia persicina]MBC3947677.1 four-helix bundle copper-binding protein [Erwinia persicina]QZQ52514.1 four-helix bundle copper-binding protein [Erwinia persicina]
MSEINQLCINACLSCLAACERCATACLQEPNLEHLRDCIRLDRQCAVLCGMTAQLLAMDSDYAPQICKLCADACEKCGKTCSQHDHDHCQICATACFDCAESCRGIAMRLP